MIQLTLILKITITQVVKMSVTVNNKSPIQDSHPDDHTQATYDGIIDKELTHVLKLQLV